jgi:hypothetical protein
VIAHYKIDGGVMLDVLDEKEKGCSQSELFSAAPLFLLSGSPNIACQEGHLAGSLQQACMVVNEDIRVGELG